MSREKGEYSESLNNLKKQPGTEPMRINVQVLRMLLSRPWL